jgi:hypothetical protein
MNVRAFFLLWAFLTINGAVFAASPPDQSTIPPELERWKPWVLHGKEDRFCPTVYHSGDQYRCIWPSRLVLALDQKGGRFTQEWLVFKKGWVPLPGGPEHWPQAVTVDGKAMPVVGRMNAPSVQMAPGLHRLEGAFIWSEAPEMIHIPGESGVVRLTMHERPVDFPLLDKQGRLWLQKRKKPDTREEKVEVRIYRLLSDTIPMGMENHLKVNISGQPREITLEGVLLKNSVPMRINSPIPARLGTDGRLMIQARPGRWEITVMSRLEGPVHKIGPADNPYGREIWCFRSQNHLRMVKVLGMPSIDPTQTDIPQKWKRYPAFVVRSGDVMTFKEIRRGDPDPGPDRLDLKRTWWLDFNGQGFTIRDSIQGTMSRQWYLAMNPPCLLGRVSVDGIDQLITAQGKKGKPGVELRKGELHLVADSRCESSTRTIPATGWDHDFQSLTGSLNIPPGWRLLTARGVDVMPGTWFERWTLLDLFLVLIISLAVFKLWDWRLGLLALGTLALTYHEPGAPRLVWLHVLASSALLRFLPDNWFKRLISFWRLGAIVALLVIAIPFMVQQVRFGVFPQLERPGLSPWSLDRYRMAAPMAEQKALERPGISGKRKLKAPRKPKRYGRSEAVQQVLDYSGKQAVLAQDPNALIQTGPGLPNWKWRSYAMRWNGPVNRDQEVRLWLLSPAVNLLLASLGVLLLGALIFFLVDFRKWRMPAGSRASAAFGACLLLFLGFSAGEAESAEYPPAELLEQLRERLLKKPDCLPNCAESPRMDLNADSDSLRILFEVHAAVETAVPLPGATALWRPAQVSIDSRPATGLARDKAGLLWVLVPEGVHRVSLVGPIPPGNTLQLPLPMRSHRVTVQARGWNVQGVDKDGKVQDSLKLTRQEKALSTQPVKTQRLLPAFLHVERLLSLGLEWQVLTTVRRVTPPGTPVIVSVPLVPGESVTTPGIRIENKRALLHMAPMAREARWRSTLEAGTIIRLQAPQSVPWTETWTLDASPIWHCGLTGIPVIHHQDRSGHWRPQWKPWPGEEVTITISRPKAIPGPTKTIDETKVTLTPGRRFNKASLLLRLRSSRGGQHKITLPLGAKVQWLKVRGKSQPIKEDRREIIVPLRPGRQRVEVEWRESRSPSFLIRAPQVTIGKEAVNTSVIFEMPKNRWILVTSGPRLGPAVLFWSYLAVIILAGLGLGRVPWTPLKTRHWLLLGLGLTQVHPLAAVMIVGWLLVLGLRKNYPRPGGWFSFNLVQILIVAWTVAALIGLYVSIQKGLLGIPAMQISGNGSSDFWLRWTQDRIGPTTPQPWVFSFPLFVYRILMLLWALWLAYSLLKWLRWGWQCFSERGLWKKIRLRKGKREKGEAPPPLPSEGTS